MDIEIRPVSNEEFDRFTRAEHRAFGEGVRDEDLELARPVFEADRSLAAFDRKEIVGTAGAYSFRLTVPGGSLPTAGVTAVGVLPTHRRRGLLTALMRQQLEDVRDRGEPVAALWASEGGIYGRFGYGVAAFAGSFEIERERTAFARRWETTGRVGLLDRRGALVVFPEVYERVRAGRPGMLDRNATRWEVRLGSWERQDRDAGESFYGAYESPGGRVDGYVAYRIKAEERDYFPTSVVRIEELMASTTEAYTALWRYCFDIDLVATIRGWGRPVDEPLLLLLAEPRRLRFRIGDGLWVRLVDVRAALEGRRYGAEDRLVFHVRDAFSPSNEGRFVLEGGPEGARCERSAGTADIELDASDLAAAFLGGTSFRGLHRAGRVSGETPGALRRADAMFASDPPPWCPEDF